MFGQDFDLRAEYLIKYYDKGDMKDKKYTDFMARMHQQHNEPPQTFRQRFAEASDELIELGRLTSYVDDPEAYVRQQADPFLSKLNTHTCDYVHDRLEKADKTLDNTDIEEPYDWAVKSDKMKLAGGGSKPNASATVTQGPIGKRQRPNSNKD